MVSPRSVRRRPPCHVRGRGAAAFLLVALFLLFSAGCSLPDDTAALVNGRPVPAAALEDAVEEFHGQFGEITPAGGRETATARKALLERLIDLELMTQEVERRGLFPSEEEVAAELRRIQGDLEDGELETVLAEAGLSRQEWIDKVGRDLALERLQQQVIEGRVKVTEGEVEEYFEGHRIDFQVPEQIRASQMLLRTKEEALAALKRVRSGEPFADVAREVSLSPDADSGGDIGYFSRSQMPQEFDAVVFSLSPGKVSSVVETAYGFHLFLVTDRREARLRDRDEVAEEVRVLLAAEKGEAIFREWLRGLRQSATIEYNESLVP